jgi:hypothetical protein
MKTSRTFFSIASCAVAAFAVPVDLNTAEGTITLQLNIDLNQGGGVAAANNIGDLFTFTSMHAIDATPDQVVNGTEPTGGLAGASGSFLFGLNSAANMIFYNITLNNFQGEFDSPATTATHIHEAALGASGPPRIAFPNPQPVDAAGTIRNSAGCLTGPFLTGVVMEGRDTGEGFTVSQIEDNPAAFMADTHSSLALPGAVRGQLG